MTQSIETDNPAMSVVSGLGDAAGPEQPAREQPVIELDQQAYSRALDCVHCGLCLPACPTYTDNGLEADSPRGRIYLMKGLADGRISPTQPVVKHLDLCLDCRACETACPSGVVYHELIEDTRAQLSASRRRTFVDRLTDFMFFHVFPHPGRVKFAMLPARLLQRLGLWKVIQGIARIALPVSLEKMTAMAPTGGPLWESNLDKRYPPHPDTCPDGKPRAVVGLLSGCVASVLAQEVNRQTIRVLQRAGCEVLVPRAQRCCGAIDHHGGRIDRARALARRNIDVFFSAKSAHREQPGVDHIVTNAAGCGAMLKDYAHLLRDDADYRDKANALTERAVDICELLVELDLPKPTRPVRRAVTYHDACHLAHAQRVTSAPRTLLSRIEGLELIPLFESDMCCGAAGTYNLAQPDMARRLAERKLQHIQATGATVCVSGNIGCTMQLTSEASRLGIPLQVVHPVTLLDEAYG